MTGGSKTRGGRVKHYLKVALILMMSVRLLSVTAYGDSVEIRTTDETVTETATILEGIGEVIDEVTIIALDSTTTEGAPRVRGDNPQFDRVLACSGN